MGVFMFDYKGKKYMYVGVFKNRRFWVYTVYEFDTYKAVFSFTSYTQMTQQEVQEKFTKDG